MALYEMTAQRVMRLRRAIAQSQDNIERLSFRGRTAQTKRTPDLQRTLAPLRTARQLERQDLMDAQQVSPTAIGPFQPSDIIERARAREASTATPIEQLGLERPLQPAAGRDLFRPILPEPVYEAIGSVPYAGRPLRSTAEFLTTPAGLAATAVAPGIILPGTAGSIAAGTAGYFAEEELGAPRGTGLAGEIVGGLGEGLATAGGRSLLRGTGRAISRQAERQTGTAGLRGILKGEAGGTKFEGINVPEGFTPKGKALKSAGDVQVTVTPREGFIDIDIKNISGKPSVAALRQALDDIRAVAAANPDAILNADVSNPRLARLLEEGGLASTAKSERVSNFRFKGGDLGGEPPVALNAAGGVQPLDDALRAIIDAPPGEKIQRTVIRRFSGEVREEGEHLRILRDDMHAAARKAGVNTNSEKLLFAADGSAATLTPSEQGVITGVRQMLDAEEAAMLRADPSFKEQLLDDYFPHFFKKATARPRPSGTTKTGIAPRFQKGRKLPGTIEEVLARRPDLDPITRDPIDMATMRVAEGVKYRAALRIRQRLESQSLAMPLSKAPADWRVPEVRVFEGRKRIIPKVTDEERVVTILPREDIAVPPEIADALNDAFGRSAFAKKGALRALRTGIATAKFLKTFGGLFQQFDFALRQLGMGAGEAGIGRVKFAPRSVKATTRALARGFVPGVDARMVRFDMADPVRSALIKNGIQLDGGLDIVEREMQDLLKDPGFLVRAGISDSKAVRLAKGAVDYVGSATYLRSHREHILSAGEVLVADFMRQGDTLEQAAAKAALRANENFSALPAWQSVFRDPTMRDAARTAFFSPNETESWFRNAGRMFTGPNRGQAIRFYGGIMATTIAWANAINFMTTGKPLPLDRYNPTTGETGELGVPFSYNTKFLRPNLPFKGPLGQEEYLDILGQADTPFRFAFAPVFGTKSRLSQPASLAVSLSPALSDQEVKDFQGRPVDSPEDFARFGFNQVAPIPVTGLLDERGRIGGIGSAIQAGGLNVSAERLADLLARKFQEIAGRPYDPQAGDRTIIEQDERFAELRPILEESTRRALEFESPTAIQRQEREGFLQQQEVEAGIPQMAQALSRGDLRAAAPLMEAFRDFKETLAIAVGRDLYGVEFDTPRSQAAKNLKSWRDIRPDQYLLDDFTTNWDSYNEAKETAYGKLSPEYRKAYEARTVFTDPAAQGLQPRLEKLLDTRSAYYDIPKYEGLTSAESERLDEWLATVRQERLQLVSETGNPDIPSRGIWLEHLDELPDDLAFFVLQRLAPAGRRKRRTARREAANPERTQYREDHPELITFFPDEFSATLELAASGNLESALRPTGTFGR